MNPDLWEHQRSAIERAVALDHFALFLPMGTGKTRTAIEIAARWCNQERRVLRGIIFCPPIVVENWVREIRKYSKLGAFIQPLVGRADTRQATFRQYSRNNMIFITNYETLTMPVYEDFKAWKPELLIFDESQRLKTPTAKRTKAAIRLADIARKRLILSGTPVLKNSMDLYAQFRILDKGATFGTAFHYFKFKWFYDANAMKRDRVKFPLWKLKPESEEAMQKLIAPISVSADKEACLTLPPFVRKTIYVPLSKEQKRIYESLRKDFIATIGDKACTPDLVITKALRMQEVVSGHLHVKDMDGKEEVIHLKAIPRLEALAEILEEVCGEHKVIIWAVFKESYALLAMLCRSLKIPFKELHGGISATKKQEAVDSFNNDPSIRILIANPAAGGVGVNLVAASYSIYYARNFSLENELQSEARNYRGGSEIHEKITRIDLVAKDTIDEVILKALAEKKTIGQNLLLALSSDF